MATGLAGRRALVTGAARGIGREIAARMASEGMRTTLLDIDPSVEAVADELGASSLVADLADPVATGAALAESVQDDPYWLLVNNAGVFSKTELLDLDLAEWDRVQDVNVRSMVVTIRALAPSMIDALGEGGS